MNSTTSNLLRKVLCTAILVITAVGTAQAVDLNPAAVAYVVPGDIKWVANPANPGIQMAFLLGNPAQPGPYTVRIKWSPGAMSRPHTHPMARYITVLSGTWWVGSGAKFDPAGTVPMRAGTFVTHFPDQVHYDGARDEEAVIQITGIGPAPTNYVTQEK